MGQVISFIFGGTKAVLEEKRPTIPDEDYSPPVRTSYYKDITEEHNRKTEAAAATIAFHQHYYGLTISPRRHHAVSDQSAGDDLRQPRIVGDSLVATSAVEETEELIAKAGRVGAASSEQKKMKNKIPEIEEAVAFHRRSRVVATSPQQQLVSDDQLAKDDLCRHLSATDHPIFAVIVEEIKEFITKAANEEATSSERKRRRRRKKMAENITEPIRKKGPYASTHKILLVGEGDFSFSASLAAAFGYASNIVATSLNNKRYLRKHYTNAMANIEELESKGAWVLHGFDASKMANHGQLLAGMKFDRIIFNFPHTGLFADSASHLSRNQMLVAGFLNNAKKMIEEDGGEIHITHKTSRRFIKWKIVELASMEGLRLLEEVPFHPIHYRGYRIKHGFGGNKSFHCYPCSSYRFGLFRGGD